MEASAFISDDDLSASRQMSAYMLVQNQGAVAQALVPVTMIRFSKPSMKVLENW